ncbi:MAG: short chain dehydrogenase [Prolixibacteraceae bacterium]|nr:short chain dehydrogenase [Prolixibacteraceae bacterium]
MKAIVIGATGTIGSAVTKVLKESGYEIVAASRNASIKADIENERSVDELLRQSGKVDAIICTAGYAAFGELNKLTGEDFSRSLNSKLMGQVKLLKKGLNYLNPGGTILLTGGIFAHKPCPGTAAIAMVNSALEGFVRAAALETEKNKLHCFTFPVLFCTFKT